MNYEELHQSLTAIEKELTDSVKLATRMNKRIAKETDTGNLTEMKKALAQMLEAAGALREQAEQLQSEVSAFDTREYFKSGDFTRQMLQACEEKGIDVRGERGVYEMFPYKVRVYGDDEHVEEVYINRKKVQSFRPSAVADAIKTGQEKLYKAAFNRERFITELADAYDTTCLKANSRPGSTISLTKIYRTLTPMSRARKDYDMQAYSFDLARLYEGGPETWVSKDGRQFTFGTSRDGNSGIRVLSQTGTETYITTLRPIASEKE